MKKLMSWLMACSVLVTACKKETKGDDPPTENDIPETAPAVQKAITANVSTNCAGYQEALPARYDSTTKKYPLMVFVHGTGELGSGSTADLAKVTNVAVPKLIKNKQFPPAFTVDGKSYSFIVISPQFKAWPSTNDMNSVVNYAISKYRVDTTRIYVAGLSMGGGITWEYGAAYASRIAAMVPICGASGPDDGRAKKISDAHLAVWAFHNKDDGTVVYTNSTGYVSKINALGANPQAKITLWDTGGHDAWTKATNPATKENNMNIYEWMLQYKRGEN